MNLNNYPSEFTPTEIFAGGTFLYITNYVLYKCYNDLNIYKKNELDSAFIEIFNLKKSNINVGVIYIHSSMGLTDFNINYLSKLLENISKEQESIFLCGNFNINLLNNNENNQSNEFLQTTRITSHSNTPIDNIFSDVINPDIIPGNLTATVSYPLPQFAIIPNMFSNISGNKSNIYERDLVEFD